MNEQEAREYERLRSEYNRLIIKNRELLKQINYALNNLSEIKKNMAIVEANVVSDVSYVANKVNVADEDVTTLLNAIESLTTQYFLFKNLNSKLDNSKIYKLFISIKI